MPVRAVVAVLAAAAALAAGCGGEEPSAARETAYGIGSGGRVDVGDGRRLYVECRGSGSPVVVLEAGFGGRSELWAPVLAELGRTTRTCAYDRAGLGGSDAIPGVHDAADELRDLERLLERARIEPPYVLVGHSYGGLLARLYARAHTGETAGVVLVDAVGRDHFRRGLAAWPKSIWPERRRALARPVDSGVDVRAGAALGRDLRSLGDTRLVVISAVDMQDQFTAAFGEPPPPRLQRRASRFWRTMQAELAELSSDRVHAVPIGSGHFIPQDHPLVVVAAARAVVRAVRDDGPLPPCARIFTGSGVRCLG